MIEAAMRGKDYHGIRDGRACMGKRVTRIERFIGGGAVTHPATATFLSFGVKNFLW